MCPFPPPEPPQPPNRIRQRSNSPSACQKVIRRQPNSGGSSQFQDRKSTRLNSSHGYISYAVFGVKKKKIALRRRVGLLAPGQLRALVGRDAVASRDARVERAVGLRVAPPRRRPRLSPRLLPPYRP